MANNHHNKSPQDRYKKEPIGSFVSPFIFLQGTTLHYLIAPTITAKRSHFRNVPHHSLKLWYNDLNFIEMVTDMFTSFDFGLFIFSLFIIWRLCEMMPYFQHQPDKKKFFYPWTLTIPALLFATLTPSTAAFMVYTILLGPFLYVLITWVNPKKISLTGKHIFIFILITILSLSFPVILLFIVFSYDLFTPYIGGLVTVFFLWLIICILPWGRKRFKKVTLTSLILLPIFLGTIYLYQINPTTYFRSVTIPYPNGEKKTFWNTDILKHIKRNQQVVALELLTVYNGIESLEFQDISENPRHANPFDGGNQFEGQVLVNGQYLVYFSFDMLANAEDLSYPDIEGPTEVNWGFKDFADEENFVRTERSLEWDSPDYVSYYDLDTAKYQKKLNSIDITYYEKNDIFKDAK